jgi:outer membrane protein assembly factor BamB
MKQLASIIVLILIASFVRPLSAVDWYRWRGPDLNGISKETGWQTQWPANGPKRAWKASIGNGFASITVSQGRAYAMGSDTNNDTLFCFDANTGSVLWKHTYACPLEAKQHEGGPCGSPTVDGGLVYTCSKKGHIFCLDAASGKVVWSVNAVADLGVECPRWDFASSPLIEGSLVILNIGEAGTAFDKKTGKVVWKSGKGPGGYSTAVPYNAGNERAVVLFLKEHVAAFKVSDGKELWRYPWKTDYFVNAADPILSGNQVFISSGYNRGATVIKISGNQATAVWENKNMRNHFNSCVLWQGHLYGVDDKELRCIVWDTGEVKWGDRQFGKGSLMLADGKLIALSEKGELIVAEATPAAFKPISRAQVLTGKCWTVPVLSNGRIYCRNAAGDLVCLDVSGK